MDLFRKGGEITIDLTRPEQAAGLWAVMTGQPNTVSPEVFVLGQQIYQWFYDQVGLLQANFDAETAQPYRKKRRP